MLMQGPCSALHCVDVCVVGSVTLTVAAVRCLACYPLPTYLALGEKDCRMGGLVGKYAHETPQYCELPGRPDGLSEYAYVISKPPASWRGWWIAAAEPRATARPETANRVENSILIGLSRIGSDRIGSVWFGSADNA